MRVLEMNPQKVLSFYTSLKLDQSFVEQRLAKITVTLVSILRCLI